MKKASPRHKASSAKKPATTRSVAKTNEDVAQAKSAFIANISHEIRTPMNAILGFAQMLQNTKLNDKQADYVDVIIDSGKKLLVIISNLLDLSNLQLGKTSINPRPCKVAEMANKIWHHFQPLIQAKNLNAVMECSSDIPIVELDCEKVERVLSFIISNAIKYTSIGFVALRIYCKSASESDFTLCFEVADSGIGIEEEKLNNIFDIFEQADNSITRPYGGLGIGLGLSRQIVLLLGGSISVQSTPHAGSRFFVEIPVNKTPESRP